MLSSFQMDPVTHLLTGAVLGRAGLNRKAAYTTLAMTLAAEAPDLDVLWGLRGPVAGFEHHRGITHSLLAAPFIALVTVAVVWLVHRCRKKPPLAPVRWALLWFFAFLADLSHLLLDFTNNYGLRPFFPFSPRWYSWDIVFIVEPLMLAVLVLALLMPWIFGLTDREIGARRNPFRGQGWAITALLLIAFLYGLRHVEHQRAMDLARSAEINGGPLLRVAAEPYPVNPFHWYAILETKTAYQTIMVDTHLDDADADSGQTIYKPAVTPLITAAKQSWLGQVYLDWSKFPVIEDKGPITPPGYDVDPAQPDWHTVQFRDLRFGYPVLSFKANDSVLSGWVYVGPQMEIEGMFMSGKEQKN